MSRRVDAMERACPKCGAQLGQPCQGPRGPRTAAHQERHTRRAATVDPNSKGRPSRARNVGAGFYDSQEWRALRYSVLRKSGGCCQCCGARGSKRKPLHVDHIKPRSKFPELAMEGSNLQVLCGDCNLGKGNTDSIDWRDTEGSACP